MARQGRFVACVLASALASSFSVAFPQMKDWGNRVEGTIDRPHAAPDYELLGFFACRQDYPLRDDVNLRLRFYLPENKPFFVEAREIKVDKQYQMLPKAEKVSRAPDGWREFTGWPVSAVLNPKRISADNLGVIVRLDRPGEDAEDLRPAVLLASQPPPAIEEYVLYLTVRRKLKSLDYQVSGVSGYSRTYQQKADQKDRSIEGRTVIPIRFTAAQFPPGPATVHIQGPYANDLTAEPLSITYRFYHKPL
jgi:hypothetical protein